MGYYMYKKSIRKIKYLRGIIEVVKMIVVSHIMFSDIRMKISSRFLFMYLM